MINLTYEYRIYPTRDQLSLMEEWLDTCRRVYNYALAERRDWIQSRKCPINACSIQREFIYPMDAEKPTYYCQKRNLTAARKDNSFLQNVHSQVLQEVIGRLEKAFNALWNSGFGFPRFKKRFRSFNFPQLGKNPIGDNQIKLPVFGWVKTVMHRPIPVGFEAKQARVVKRASGWYIQLVIQSDVKIPEPPIKGYAIGIDMGLTDFVATSEGELIARPRFFVEAQHRLKVLNRAVARKQKGSKNQQKARQRVARFYERIANRRKDFHRKLAHHLCDQAGMIFAEELNLKGLAKGMLGKHCLDAGWGQFLDTLRWVCFKRGVHFQKVKAAGTSQECPACGVAVRKDLSVRRHECPECGYITNRDVASGQVIRNRGLIAVGQTVQSCGAIPDREALKQEYLKAI
ncbi:transposase [Picosynechococcus sp. PCC 7003]|uniref:RNA-guided endonuclease InsQ/TnpB family protein n=1 Tax=Picosynechococcus sp. PCC 7003 TaxID=374981 RepID=UPI000810B81A|nr:RNA-guided endonuclease TnpB family protein [Picosynechococcus sp. PCC 7003]ANV85421.1 transposase [Picosynechococcus sp. PCC 7003]